MGPLGHTLLGFHRMVASSLCSYLGTVHSQIRASMMPQLPRNLHTAAVHKDPQTSAFFTKRSIALGLHSLMQLLGARIALAVAAQH